MPIPRYTGTLDQRHMRAALDAEFRRDMIDSEPGLAAAHYERALAVVGNAPAEVIIAVRDGELPLMAAYTVRGLSWDEQREMLRDGTLEARAAQILDATTAARQAAMRKRGVFGATMQRLRALMGLS